MVLCFKTYWTISAKVDLINKNLTLFINDRDLKGSQNVPSLAQRGFSVGWILIYQRETRQYHCGKACPCPAQPYEGLQIPISTPEKISPTLLEMPPNSWPNEAFSLTSDARAFLIRGTQYPLSPWPGSEISQVMGGTVDTLSSYLPPT